MWEKIIKLVFMVSLLFSFSTSKNYQTNGNVFYSFVWSSADDFTVIGETQDYLLIKKVVSGVQNIGYSLIGKNNGKELWENRNDLIKALEKENTSSIILNNKLLIISKNNTSLFDIISGQIIWQNEALKDFNLTKQLDANTIQGSIDKDRNDKLVEIINVSLITGKVVSSYLFQLKNANSGEYNNIILYGISKQRLIFMVNGWIECYNEITKKFIWQREVTPPYLSKIVFFENNVLFPATLFYESCSNYDLTTKIFSVNMDTGKDSWNKICSYNFEMANNYIYCLRKQCTDDGYPEFVKLDGKSGKTVATYKPNRIRKMDAWLLLKNQIIVCPISSSDTGDLTVMRWEILNRNLELIYKIDMNAKPLKDGTIIYFGEDFFLLKHKNIQENKDIISYFKLNTF
jgi:hypothetical protein